MSDGTGRAPARAPLARVSRLLALAGLAALSALGLGCASSAGGNDGGDGGDNGGPTPDTVPVYGKAADYTYALTQSTAATRLWTTPTCVKVFPETSRSAVPENTGSEIRLYAAASETEAFQIVLWSQAGESYAIRPPEFGIGETTTLHRVGYVPVADARSNPGLWPDPLIPQAAGAAYTPTAQRNQPFWVTVALPEATAPGDYTGSLQVVLGTATLTVPVKLHVFGFTLPRARSLASLVDSSYAALGAEPGEAEAQARITEFWHAHRLNPSTPTLPASLPDLEGVDYDCVAQAFDDTVGGSASLATLGARYLDGAGWNNTGFSAFLALRYLDEAHPRPETFCGAALGDPYGSAEYNLRWQGMLAALDSYLEGKGWSGKAYYHVMGRPADAEARQLAAYLAETARAVAPGLRLAIASAPRTELTDNETYTHAGFDLWMPSLAEYASAEAELLARQAEGEQAFWRLSADEDPSYPAPVAIDVAGLDSRLLGFAAFGCRADGLYLPETTAWPTDPWSTPSAGGAPGLGFVLYPAPGAATSEGPAYPSIRLELLREAAEDYEYLVLANGSTKPAAGGASALDTTVGSATAGLTAWTRDAEGFMELRRQLGRYIAGERATLPVLEESHGTVHPSGSYYLNFQDPDGQPTASPLVVEGHTYAKVGWDAYDPDLGFGWTDVTGATTLRTQWIPQQAFDALRRSIVWDESGAERTFEFALDDGDYEVTVSVGWAGRRTVYRHHRVVAEGVTLISPGLPELSGYLLGAGRVTVTDGALTVRVGGAELGGETQPTMLNYLEITPAP